MHSGQMLITWHVIHALSCAVTTACAFGWPRIMTPTRTGSTLWQEGREFKHKFLHNTHSHLKLNASDATRSTVGARTRRTVAPHANNEQEPESSNGVCRGEHTREQLINWVMSKGGVASCFIKDVLSMSESEHGGGRLSLWMILRLIPTIAGQVFPTTCLVAYPADRFR